MTQQKIDDLFSMTPSSTRSSKRSRTTQIASNDRDELDDLFETASSTKRRRTNHTDTKQSTDVFDFDLSSTTTTTSSSKKTENSKLSSSLKKKRSATRDDDDENKAIDELFNNDTRKKIRRPIKQEESTDVLDLFKTKTNTNVPQVISTIDDFKTPVVPRNGTTQKKIKMFFDESELISLREQANEQNDTKDYVHVKPVLVTGGQWLSKEVETKITHAPVEPSSNPSLDNNVPDNERNLMHIQYVSLIVDDQIDSSHKKSHGSKRRSQASKSSSNSTKTVLNGKSFHKQLVLSDSTILRKDNLQSCYNALLEDINKPRILNTSSSTKSNKSSTFKSSSSRNDEIVIGDDDNDEQQANNIDFFDLTTRRKKT